MVTPMDARLLGIDWGTSNRRAYLVDRAGTCVRRHADDQGLLAAVGDFAGSLAALRRAMRVDASLPVVMAGMVGSAGGWQQVPYLATGVALEDLPRHLVAVRDCPNCWIVPGYATEAPDVDVMRGEETQILGAGVRDGWLVLPGTHSKWVHMRDGKVERLSTYMTGELFALLGTHGTLRPLMAEAGAAEDEGAFADGLQAARRPAPLTHSLFGVRVRAVTGRMSAAQARSYVSGLLIGTEFVASGPGPDAGTLHLIASDALAGRYTQAARHFGYRAAVLDPDQVFLAALEHFIRNGQS
jgi:2-dehydro-3-deoxygalactonokinase